MIKLIGKTIKEKLKIFSRDNFPLRFLKFSTPSSGVNLNDKVIFFVFGADNQEPLLCIKTVRFYNAGKVIRRSFKNLQQLNQLTKGSRYQNMFASPLYLYDDGENIFSLESACQGRRLNPTPKNLKAVIENYLNFQEHCFKKEKNFIQDLHLFGKSLIRQGNFEKDDQTELLKYFNNFSFGQQLTVPKVIQHGDLTLDNILFNDREICIVDYDYLGLSYLPGFDLFNLLARQGRDLLHPENPYWVDYLKKMDIELSNIKPIFFLSYLSERIFKKKYLLKDKTATQIIGDFEETLS